MSTFVLRREYALQMPNNFVDVDMDEMEYVEGGGDFSNWFFSVDNVGAMLDTAIALAIPVGGMTAFVAKKGAANAARYLEAVVVNKLKGMGLKLAGISILVGIEWALNYISPGAKIAEWLDSRDASPYNEIVWF